MSFRVISACFAALTLIASPANAHHPGGGGNAGGGGPIITIPADTLEQGHAAVAFWYEYVRLGGLSDAQLMAAGIQHIHAHSIKTIESAVAAFAYGVTDNLMVAVRAPVNRRADIREGEHVHVGGVAIGLVDERGDSTGFGDVTLLAQWRFLNNVVSLTQAAVLFGVKAPTGTTNLYDQLGELFETEFQPGTGSWDWLLGGAFSQRFGSWSFDANVLFIGAGNGAQQTNMGNRFLYNAAVTYRLIGPVGGPRLARAHEGHPHNGRILKAPQAVPSPPSWTLDAVLEFNGEWHARQKTAGAVDENSGGHTIYLSPGLRASYDRFSHFVLVGIPILNDLNGLQSEPRYRIVSGMSFGF
jgi:hypothetical protein